MTTLCTLAPYLRSQVGIILSGVVLILIANLIALVPPLVLGNAVDSLGRHEGVGTLGLAALEIVGVALVAAAFQFSSRYVINSASRRIEYTLRGDLFSHFQTLDLAYFQRGKIGDLVARATNDLSAIRMMLGPGMSNLVNTLVAFAVTAIAMVRIDARLTLYSLTVMPIITLLFVVLGASIQRRFRAVQDQFGEVSARAQENFSGIRVVKAFAQESAELTAFNRINGEYVTRSIRYARLNALLWPAMQFIAGLAAAILLWRGGLDVIEGTIQLGRLVQFNTYIAALMWPMIALGWTVNLFQQGSASLARVQEVRETPPAIRDTERTRAGFAPERGAVELRHVSLRYEDDGPEVLHDINIAVPAGTSLAIVGATGAGKSSIVNLIARVYDATEGQVLVDGVDVREIPLHALRETIGYVPQENFLFSLTLEENVAFGLRDEITPERLEHALRISQLGKDVADFPAGVQTMIGERGVTLSGGQKQRAGIARAVAKDPLILILDDSMSSVDTNTEAAILAGLREVMAGRTSILIAHRVSTVKDLDQIVVLDGGRIVERGTHADLLALGGRYAAMYRRQLLSEEMADDAPDADDDDGLPDGDGGRDTAASGGRGREGRAGE